MNPPQKYAGPGAPMVIKVSFRIILVQSTHAKLVTSIVTASTA
jgi:hypothetical protein